MIMSKNKIILEHNNRTGVRLYLTKKSIYLAVRLLVFVISPDKGHHTAINVLVRRIIEIWDNNGAVHCVDYLKNSFIATVQYLAGERKTSPVKLANHLPCIIPGSLRQAIRRREVPVLRTVLTILSCYRVMKCTPRLKLNTITDAFTGISETLNESRIIEILRPVKDDFKIENNHKSLRYSQSAGPNHHNSLLSLGWDALWLITSDIYSSFEKYALATNQSWLVLLLQREVQSMVKLISEWSSNSRTYVEPSVISDTNSDADDSSSMDQDGLFTGRCINARFPVDTITYLRSLQVIGGRLSKKNEPAGKVRVFAITDGWTQTLLKPLHDAIFQFLKTLPQDGTWDQGAPVDRLVGLLADRDDKFSASYDLSAATDRLPVKLQIQCLKVLIGEAASCWADILVKRPWYLSTSAHEVVPAPIFYQVGQPMGALSSWGMLALTHHVIVQYSAIACGYKPWEFTDYALLGDDIVICNRKVATSYHTLMTEVLGVVINPSKSIVSESGLFEFAKRLVSPLWEISPLGFGGIMQAIYNPCYIPALLYDYVQKTEGSWESISRIVRTMPKAVLKRERFRIDLEWSVWGPFGFVKNFEGLSSLLKIDNSLDRAPKLIYLTSLRETAHVLLLSEWKRSLNKLATVYTSLFREPWSSNGDHLALPSYLGYMEKVRDSYNSLGSNQPLIPSALILKLDASFEELLSLSLSTYFRDFAVPEGNPWEISQVVNKIKMDEQRKEFFVPFDEFNESGTPNLANAGNMYTPPEEYDDLWSSYVPGSL